MDRLYLSYVDRDAQTGDPLEPSPVVRELIRHLDRDQIRPVNVWIESQPLRRFADGYFWTRQICTAVPPRTFHLRRGRNQVPKSA